MSVLELEMMKTSERVHSAVGFMCVILISESFDDVIWWVGE